MNSQKIFRLLGLSVILGSLLLVAGYQLRPDILKENIDQFAGDKALLSSLLVPAGTILLLAGLPALFLWENQQNPHAGFTGYLITFIAIAFFYLGTIALYFVLPVLVHNPQTRPLIYSDDPPFPGFAFFWAFGMFLLIVGLCWLGIRIWKSKIYPRVSSILLISGGLSSLVSVIMQFQFLKLATVIIMAGFISLGICLVRNAGRSVQL